MKKYLIAFLLSLSCAFTIAAVGCDDDDEVASVGGSSQSSSSSEIVDTPQGEYTVHFTNGEGYKFVSATANNTTVSHGDIVMFSIDVGAFYAGTPIVSLNGQAIAPDDLGVYSVTATQNMTFTVAGVQKDVSSMNGDGSFESPFMVTRPVDLLFIADKVNAGDYAYVTGTYMLANDIDCKGEELKVIGDLRNENAYFAGCFSCYNDGNTGESTRYTISNFTINSTNSNYVGLFGAVMVDLSVTSSGLFYGINLDNFTITASIDDPVDSGNLTITCGSLIGYGIGARTYLCDSTNGTLNVYSDDAYFSFVGGLIGYQQGVYIQEYDSYYPSEVAYANVDVDVNILKGAALYAGGISGYLTTNYPFAAAYIHNSYATGNVNGAIRAGGIAGGLGQHTSVSNCYATGKIAAKATQTLSSATMAAMEYCYANAGGLVGFAENDTIVNDAFFNGSLSATAAAGAAYENTAAFVGGGYEQGTSSAGAAKFVVFNCADNVPLSSITKTLKNTLGWKEYNWIMADGELPIINYEPSEAETATTTTITRKYIAKTIDAQGNVTLTPTKVNGATELTLDYLDSSDDPYVAIGEAFANGSLDYYYEADNGYLSFGLYLDENLTQKLPFSYLTTRNATFYVGFADPTLVVGEYTIVLDGSTKPVTLTLNDKGKATYTDGATTQTTNYLFDGDTLIIESAKLARYYFGEVVTEDENADPNFDLNRYAYYDFKGVLDGNLLKITDTNYFTNENPLIAIKGGELLRGEFYTDDDCYYTLYGSTGTLEGGELGWATFTYAVNNGVLTLVYEDDTTETVNVSALKSYDAFKGVWKKSATVSKFYEFDGKGNWSYAYKAYIANGMQTDEQILESASGKYVLNDDGTATLDNNYVVSVDENGFLVVVSEDKTQTYYANDSFNGTWIDKTTGIQLTLHGVGYNSLGEATLLHTDGFEYALTYERSETDGYLVLYQGDILFGCCTYYGYNILSATLYDFQNAETTYTAHTLYLQDNYNGDWISNDPTFETVRFNGEGFSFINGNMQGKLTINGSEVTVTYTLQNSTLNGQFAYNRTLYTLSFDEDTNTIIITGDTQISLERKDKFAGIVFVDETGNVVRFDGKSNLLVGGTFTFGGKTYGYKQLDGEYIVYDGETAVGALTQTEKYYELTIEEATHKLYIQNKWMGNWAISGEYALFTIKATNITGTVNATFKGYEVEMSYIDSTLMHFRYFEGNMPMSYYVFLIDDETIAVSQYANLYSGDYQICSKANTMFGVWKQNTTSSYQKIIYFDGVSSDFQNGQAKITMGSTSTNYYYAMRDGGIVLWSQNILAGNTLYYKVEFVDDIAARNAYSNGEKAFRLVEVDALYLTYATDTNGVTYTFDGGNVGDNVGVMTASNGKTYTYKVTAYNTNATATLLLTDKETGVTYNAILDYTDSANMKLIIEQPAV